MKPLFRTYYNSTLVVIDTPDGRRDNMNTMTGISEWAKENCQGEIEVWPADPGKTDNVHVLCEFESDATLIALRWAK